MERKYETELEALMERELRRLPLRKAPSSLAPRVLAAIQARTHAPWWKRPIWTWPCSTQWLVATLIFAVLITGASVAATATTFSDLWAYWAGCQSTWTVLTDCAEILLSSVAIMLRSIQHPWMQIIAGTVAALYVFCLCTGTLFYRLAVKRI
jgi:hypothetical protein